MQPEPAVFLRGLRREMLRYVDTGMASADASYPMTLRRAGETLAWLWVRQERLPAIVRAVRPRLMLLQDKLAVLLNACAGDAPMSAPLPESDDGEAAIADYDARLKAISVQLAAAFAIDGAAREADALGREAGRIEREVRDAIAAALRETIAEDADRLAAVPGEAPLSIEEATRFLRSRVPQAPDIRVDSIRRQPGVNTKEIMFLTLADQGDWPQEIVLRRNRPVDTVGNVVADEFGLLRHLHDAGLPVPDALIADASSPILERPALVMARAAGAPRSPNTLGAASGPIVEEMALFLARLHAIDGEEIDSIRRYGADPRARTLAMVERFYRLRADNDNQPSALLEYAFQWLRHNVHVVGDATAVIHGDYNWRNILIADGRISAVLDWELAHIGHPAEDLAYCRPQMEELGCWENFLSTYRSAGGMVVTDDELKYFQIYSEAFRLSTIFPASNGYCTGGHNDFLIGGAGFIEYSDQQRDLANVLLADP